MQSGQLLRHTMHQVLTGPSHWSVACAACAARHTSASQAAVVVLQLCAYDGGAMGSSAESC